MTTDMFRRDGVAEQVHALVCEGRIPESQRAFWEGRLMRDSRSMRELHLERPVAPPVLPEPEANPHAYVAKSGGQQLQEWCEAQPDWGQASGDPVPPRPSFTSPSTTASGIPVRDVQQLDWRVQACVAREPNRAVAHGMIEEFTGVDADLAIAIACEGSGPARPDVEMYEMEMERWAADPAVPLREVQEALSQPPRNSSSYTPRYSRDPADTPEAARTFLDSLKHEVRHHDPSGQRPYRTQIDLDGGI